MVGLEKGLDLFAPGLLFSISPMPYHDLWKLALGLHFWLDGLPSTLACQSFNVVMLSHRDLTQFWRNLLPKFQILNEGMIWHLEKIYVVNWLEGKFKRVDSRGSWDWTLAHWLEIGWLGIYAGLTKGMTWYGLGKTLLWDLTGGMLTGHLDRLGMKLQYWILCHFNMLSLCEEMFNKIWLMRVSHFGLVIGRWLLEDQLEGIWPDLKGRLPTYPFERNQVIT